MLFLGTAAADVLPGPLCSCPICSEARQNPAMGRLRSMFMLDGENLIDCGPDFAAAVMRHGADITRLKNIFITHTHEDHLDYSNAGLIKYSRTRPEEPVDVYMSEMALESVMRLYQMIRGAFSKRDSVQTMDKGLVRLHPVRAGEHYSVGGYEMMPVNTTHHASASETAYNYLFKKNGKSLLYATDTGFYIEESLELLKGTQLDFLVMEGTWGDRTDKPTTSHMNAFAFVEQLEIFRRYDIIRADTEIFCTHINHKHNLNHDAYQRWFREHTDYHVTVAYDGLNIGPLG